MLRHRVFVLRFDKSTTDLNRVQFVPPDASKKDFVESRFRIEGPRIAQFHNRHGEGPFIASDGNERPSLCFRIDGYVDLRWRLLCCSRRCRCSRGGGALVCEMAGCRAGPKSLFGGGTSSLPGAIDRGTRGCVWGGICSGRRGGGVFSLPADTERQQTRDQ